MKPRTAKDGETKLQIVTEHIRKRTDGPGDIIDLTPDLTELLEKYDLKEGTVTVFVVGSTAGITTIEYEPGLVKDMDRIWEQIAPQGPDYAHHQTWGDQNGFSHVRAALQGPSLVVPFKEGRLLLGTWQQVVLMEFDDRPRDRTVVAQYMGY
ncbi:MAG: secondary thiamine-phosphate synthase enzyme YjbQ [Elusimicrobia bacterium]|nr:secondary thiamine-phosphate synthase enzyme YjbQ [Candidatus Obscuribacterium magneticum]